MKNKNTEYVESLLDRLIEKTKKNELSWKVVYHNYETNLGGSEIQFKYEEDGAVSYRMWINGEIIIEGWFFLFTFRSISKKIRQLCKLVRQQKRQREEEHKQCLAKSVLDELKREQLITEVAGIDDE